MSEQLPYGGMATIANPAEERLSFTNWIMQLHAVAYRLAKGVVLRGPFAGMRLCSKFTWCSGDITAVMTGLYEQEIVPYLVGRQYHTILNIGCSEGYYAVGMALRYPKAIVHAFDC